MNVTTVVGNLENKSSYTLR